MDEREPRAEQRPVAPVEGKKARIWPVIKTLCDSVDEIGDEPACPEPRAFEAEKRNFVERIHRPEHPVELEAVDDDRRLAEKDVLGPKVAMALDDLCLADALAQQRMCGAEGLGKNRQCWRQALSAEAKSRIRQDCHGGRVLLLEHSHMRGGRDRHWRQGPIEGDKAVGNAGDVIACRTSLPERHLKRRPLRQATHLDQPVDDLSLALDREPLAVPAKRARAEIDIGREPPVQPDFVHYRTSAPRKRPEVEKVVPDRLLQLVDPVAGKEDPGHVRLLDAHLRRRVRVGMSIRQKGDLPVRVRISGRTARVGGSAHARRNAGRAPESLMPVNAAADEAGTVRLMMRSVEDILLPADSGRIRLPGRLDRPSEPQALILFAHGSGSSRLSPRNRFVAEALSARGFATLLFDLLTEDEAANRAKVFDIPLLASRLSDAIRWSRSVTDVRALALGLFGASTGAAAALVAAAEHPEEVEAIVSRGGRPDLAANALSRVLAPTLLLVGSEDPQVIRLNKAALASLACKARLVLVPGATHLFEEPGTLETVVQHADTWFSEQIGRRGTSD